MDTEMLIGAAFEKGAEAEEAVLNPRTGATILSLPEASEAQIERAVAAAERPSQPGRAPRPHSAPPIFSGSPTASRPRPRNSRRSKP